MTFADAHSHDDAGLAAAAREGDHAAYSALFERHRAAVEEFAGCLTRGRGVTALVSAAFVEGLGRVLEGAAADVAFRPWLLRVVADCHGAVPPVTSASSAFWSLPPSQQSLIWSALIDEVPADPSAFAAATENLRTRFLSRQRDDAAARHARIHLDDLEGHADTCATCLGLWWRADELTSPTSLARTVLGAAAERYVRQRPLDRRRPPSRPCWLPVAFVGSVAAMLFATSLGTLAVAHWRPGGVAPVWHASSPSATPDPGTAAPAPPGQAPTPPETGPTPAPIAPPETGPTPAPHSPPTPSPPSAPAPGPAAPPASEEPAPPQDMSVAFAFDDPRNEYVVRNGTTYQARHIRFLVVAEEAQGTHERAVTMRFDFAGDITYLGTSNGLSCSPSDRSVTCTAPLAPGGILPGTITVEDEQGSGLARLHTSDDPSATHDHVFEFGPWTGAQGLSPSPLPDGDDTAQAPAGS
ncbi:RNA polymerase sigma factor [uncultured Aeromicrobium sp.]|uniref:RNA polymerase sigma factor n=1 Tax=uncultured Aeromicrobium sp. TaxID=337820 RepID=UPI0025DF0E3E|nr:hypothetical protein [uncultured Aeromicrobium sp.]